MLYIQQYNMDGLFMSIYAYIYILLRLEFIVLLANVKLIA